MKKNKDGLAFVREVVLFLCLLSGCLLAALLLAYRLVVRAAMRVVVSSCRRCLFAIATRLLLSVR